MKFTVAGQTYEMLDQSSLSFADAEDLERVTGMSVAQIDRKSRTCVCAHYLAGHPKNGPCVVCEECPEFASTAPLLVSTACMWLSMRQDNPALTLDEVRAIRQADIEILPDVDEPANPTALPAGSAGDATNTS